MQRPVRVTTPPHENRGSGGSSGNHKEPPLEELTEEQRAMRLMLGFGSFHSTKGLAKYNVWGQTCAPPRGKVRAQEEAELAQLMEKLYQSEKKIVIPDRFVLKASQETK